MTISKSPRIYFAAFFLLAGCATPTAVPTLTPANQAAIKQEQDEQARLMISQYQTEAAKIYVLAASLLHGATDICAADKVGPSFGIFEINALDALPREYRTVAREAFGIRENVTLTYLDPQSPLSVAGLRPGDEILGMNGKTFPTGRRGVARMLEAVEDLKSLDPLQLQVRREGNVVNTIVTPIRFPKLAVIYHPFDSDVNAYADGSSLNILRGLVRAAQSEDAMAMILAHEIAHNCQRHIEAKMSNARIGAFFDLLAAAYGDNTGGAFTKFAAGSFSQDFEREADYVGLYYLARAGRPLTEARTAFRMLTSEGGGGLTASYGSSHPSNPERFIRLQAAEQEIQEKIRNGQPLVPNANK